MKRIIIAIIAIAVIANTEASDDQTTKYEFPRIGATYSLTYDKMSEGHYLPLEVTIIAKGDGQWYFVEYERAHSPMRRLIGKSDSEPTPEATPTPPVTIERQWINFALLLAAAETK